MSITPDSKYNYKYKGNVSATRFKHKLMFFDLAKLLHSTLRGRFLFAAQPLAENPKPTIGKQFKPTVGQKIQNLHSMDNRNHYNFTWREFMVNLLDGTTSVFFSKVEPRANVPQMIRQPAP